MGAIALRGIQTTGGRPIGGAVDPAKPGFGRSHESQPRDQRPDVFAHQPNPLPLNRLGGGRYLSEGVTAL